MRILWLSRHSPQASQLAVLREKFGNDVVIIQRDVGLDNDAEKGADQVVAMMREVEADDIVGVLPPSHLGALLRRGIQPIRAVMNRRPTGRTLPNGEREYIFEFDHFERVVEISIKTIPL